jgi:major type 1 subunit fimbrin (pilin)
MNVVIASSNRKRNRWIQLLAILFLLIGSKGAWATTSCSGPGGATTLTFPSAVAVPRDLPVGKMITSWVQSTASTTWYSCSVDGGTYTGISAMATTPSASVMQISDGGTTFNVFPTGVAGVGFAIGTRGFTNGCGWDDWSYMSPGISNSGWTDSSCNQNGNITNGGQVQVALVKTGAITPGLIGFQMVAKAVSSISKIATTSSNPYTFSTTPVAISVLACQTPDVTVALGAHGRSELTGPNTFTSATGFNISLNSCPGGMNSIQYRIDPVTTVVNSAQSVVALNSGSAATGVGVQLLNSAGTAAFPLSSWQTFSGYSTATGGSYSIPLKARYYQTASTVVPGTANTSMTFTMQYQ